MVKPRIIYDNDDSNLAPPTVVKKLRTSGKQAWLDSPPGKSLTHGDLY